MKKLLITILSVLTLSTAWAQHVELSYYLPNHAQYNQNIPTPESVLGYQVGDFYVQHPQLVNYLKAIEAASERVKLVNYGYTNERKPLCSRMALNMNAVVVLPFVPVIPNTEIFFSG